MTPEQLYEIAFVVAAARTHATDAEYVKEIDPLTTKLIDAVQESWRERDDAIRLGDERLATLWDEKKAEIAKIAAERDEAREALEAMVLNCRYGCNRDSNCGVCAIALEAMPNGWPAQSEDE